MKNHVYNIYPTENIDAGPFLSTGYNVKALGLSIRACSFVLIPLCLIITLIEDSPAFLLFSGMWIGLSITIIFLVFDKKNRKQSLRVFFLFYTIYLIFMLLTNYVYVKDPFRDCFYNPDSIKFFSRIDYLFKVGSPSNMYDWMEGFYVGDWKGFGAIIWTIALITDYLGEPNNIIIQKLQIVFLCALIIVFLYNMCINYLHPHQAWKATIAFGLLSHIMVFSGIFMRDIHMVFIYTVGFYILFNRWNFTNFIILFGLAFFAWQIRSHNGIFFLAFIALYLYLKVKTGQPKIANFLLVMIAFITIAVVVSVNVSTLTGDTSDEVSTYQGYHEEKLEESSGLTGLILKAPTLVRPVLFITLSQIYPFPVYRGMFVNYINDYQYLLFPLCIAEIFWIYVLVFLLYGYLKKRYRKLIPQTLKYCLALALLYIVAAGSTSYEFRRLMAVYPLVFLVAAVIYYNLPEKKSDFLKRRTTLGYIGVLAAYLLLTFLR